MDVVRAVQRAQDARRRLDDVASLAQCLVAEAGALQARCSFAEVNSTLLEPQTQLLAAHAAVCRERRRAAEERACDDAAALLASADLSLPDCVRIAGALSHCDTVFGAGEGALSLHLFYVECRMRHIAARVDAALAAAAGSNARLFEAILGVMRGPVLQLAAEYSAIFGNDAPIDLRAADAASTLSNAGSSAEERRAGQAPLKSLRRASVLAAYLHGRTDWCVRSVAALAGAARSTAVLGAYWNQLVVMDRAYAAVGASFLPLLEDVLVDRAADLICDSRRATLDAIATRMAKLGGGAQAAAGLQHPGPAGYREDAASSEESRAGTPVPEAEVRVLHSGADAACIQGPAAASPPPGTADPGDITDSAHTISPPGSAAAVSQSVYASPSPKAAMDMRAPEVRAPPEIAAVPLLVLAYNGVLAGDFFDQLRGLALPRLRDTACAEVRALCSGLRATLSRHPLCSAAALATYDAGVAPLYVWLVEQRYYPSSAGGDVSP